MITVVVPTYNRPRFVARAIDYWGESAWPILVADGSPEPFRGKFPSNVTYVNDYRSTRSHGLLGFSSRVVKSLETISTEFVVLCSDDDFIGFNAIRACVKFLIDNVDYVAAHGDGFKFTQLTSPPSILIPSRAPRATAHKVDGMTARLRMQQAMKPYVPLFYAVHRKGVLQATFDSIEGASMQSNDIELQVALVASVFGKHVFFPFFYTARETIPGSEGTVTEDFGSWLANQANATELNLWRNLTARLYAEAEHATEEEGQTVFDEALEAYLEVCSDKRTPLTSRAIWKLKPLLRKLIPRQLLSQRRRRLDQAAIAASKFPWSDESAREDWRRMKAMIQKHGVLA